MKLLFDRFRWVKDGEKFDVSGRVGEITQKSDTGTLMFVKPRTDDQGEYICLAENVDGTARSNSIYLRRAFFDNFKNITVQTVKAEEGEALKLECKAPDGYPMPSKFWIVQTTHGELKSLDSSRVVLDPAGNLWFPSLSRADVLRDSYYVCSAASSVFNEYKFGNRIKLEVIPRSVNSLNGSPPSLKYVSSPELFVLRGKKAEIFCIYGGVPAPKIAWSKDGKPLANHDRIFLENNGKSLKIKNAQTEDEGNYECEISSEIGEKQSSKFKLKVESPPSFTVEPQSLNVTKGQTAEIKCESVGVPEPDTEWFFNGKEIKLSDNSRRVINKLGIVIKDVEKSDTGNYVCYAKNKHGFISRDVYINVKP